MAVWLAFQACLAGFLLFPGVTGFFAWNRGQRDWLWVTVSAWSVTCALWILANAALLWPGTPASLLGPLLAARHVLIVLGTFSLLTTLFVLTGHIPVMLATVTFALFLVRAVLFFTTDLIWTHAFTPDGRAIYGPLRNPFTLVLILPVVAIVIGAVIRRPWQSELARRAVLFSIVPGILLWVASAAVPGVPGEYASSMAAVPGVIAIQLLYFQEFRRQLRRNRLAADREARLAAFGTQILSVPASVPQLAAVTLIADVLGAPCAYLPVGRPEDAVASDDSPLTDPSPRIDVPVRVAGTTDGHLVVGSNDPDKDDEPFVRAVATVLAAALERAQTEAKLREHALLDQLTGLPNWALLQDRLLRLLDSRGDLPVGLMCCDIAGLKDINDEFGHDAGDAVLRTVAARLSSLTHSRGTVARIGSDQFLVAQPDSPAPATQVFARRLMHVVAEPIAVADARIHVRLRVGFTVAAGPERDVGRLVRDAEMALMRAKREDLTVAAYDAELRAQLVGHRRMERAFRQALDTGALRVAYQPIVDLRTMRVIGLEALARWTAPDGSDVPPSVFVPLAESTGTIAELGAQVLEQAVGQLSAWSAAHREMNAARLSINVSPTQLDDPELGRRIKAVLDAHGIAPERLTIEVTESALVESDVRTVRQLERIRAMGVSLSLDDFGTGYSTLTRLMAFPVTELKIDAEFTRAAQGPAREIVPAIVGLAHASGLSVVAEGIETPDQYAMVVAEDCDHGQGFLFDRPLPPEQVPARFRWAVNVAGDAASAVSSADPVPEQRPTADRQAQRP